MLRPIIEKTLDEMLSGKELSEDKYLPREESGWMEGNNHGFIRDRLPFYHDPIKRKQIIERFNDVVLRDGKLVLYRGLMHNSDVRLKNLGLCWTFNEAKAYCYGTQIDMTYWYKYFALVPVNSVNWYHTIQKGMVFHSHEKEVRLLQDAPINIFMIEKRKRTVCDLLEVFDYNFETKA